MELGEFLLHKTKVRTLVHIKEDGWNAGVALIDHEDLFIRGISSDLLDKEVKGYKWSTMEHITEHGDTVFSNCLVVDV